MPGLESPDWADMFAPDESLWGSFLRGVVVYLSVLVMFRVVLRRQGGSIGLPDVMLVVLVSEAASQGLTGDAKSVPNGLVTVLALLVCNYTLDWLSYRWPWLHRLLEPPPLVLVENGRVRREHLERERISGDELAAQLRENGVDDVSRVKRATLESEGSVSVVKADDPPPRLSVEEATARLVEAADVLKRALAWHEQQK
jgi:uncharacterized membrane protein YcaP (DUF421 family)